MSKTPNADEPDPELSDIDALRREERGRVQSRGRVQDGSTILIILAVLVLLALALAVIWVTAGT